MRLSVEPDRLEEGLSWKTVKVFRQHLRPLQTSRRVAGGIG